VWGVKKLIWVAISLEYQLRRKDFFSLFSLKFTASLEGVVVIEISTLAALFRGQALTY
jgi:hypothetical protein